MLKTCLNGANEHTSGYPAAGGVFLLDSIILLYYDI